MRSTGTPVSEPVWDRMTEEARYILAKKIARGGMAEIYLGKQVGEDGFQRLCAIKRILPHYSGDQEFIQMFRDEAHICKRLQHANIVRVEGFEEVEGSYAIIMEFVDGADLRTLLHAVEQAKKKMPVPMACYIIAEAARGLHYAHTKVDEITQQALGIVHRDISPQNILVSYEGEIKVTDFGIADAESKLTETRPGIVKGKYSYMSPEQIAAKPVDCRTDVFALSIVLWEMLAMRRLFQGENEVDTIQRVKNCRIDVELRQLNAEVDEELDGILKKGLAKDPKRRYRTAADFEKDLRRYMSRRHPDFTPEDLGNFLKKNMESRRSESAADIKKTLTETNLRPGRKTAGVAQAGAGQAKGGAPAGNKSGVDLALEAGSGPALSLARPVGLQQSGNRGASPVSQIQRPTSFNKPAHTRNTNHAAVAAARRNNSNKSLLYAAVAVVALAVGGVALVNSRARNGSGSRLKLVTTPQRVRVVLDNVRENHGRFVLSNPKRPNWIEARPGEHTLLITAPHYEPYRTRVNLEEGKTLVKDDIVLKPQGLTAAVKIRPTSAPKSLRFDVEDGFFVYRLAAGQVTPVAVDSLVKDKTYQLRVVVGDEGERKESFRCTFTPKSTNWHTPNEVVVDPKRRTCTMLGP